MKYQILLGAGLLSLAAWGGAPAAQNGAGESAPVARIQAVVDPRVELLSLVFRLAGRHEYNHPQSASPYASEVEAIFGPFRDHPAIELARQLTRERGISYDAVMSLAVHLTDIDTLGERVPFDRPPAALERRWNAASARAFVQTLSEFVEDTGFREFAVEQEGFYARGAARLQAVVDELTVLDWFDRFFGPKQGASFRVVVGLLNGPGNYGVRVVLADGSEEISPVIGADRWDSEGLPVFGQGFAELLAHEFCHSYTNPLVQRHMDLLSAPGRKLLEAKRTLLEAQAYGSVESVLNEVVVRACVGRYVLETGGEAALQRYVSSNHGRGFVWTAALVETLAAYEGDRERYPALTLFVPRLAERMGQLAAELEALSESAPKVVSVTPADGAADVKPGAVELRVEFDRPMRDRSWSICRTDRPFPQIGSPAFDATRRVFTLQMVLEPGRTYGLSLNCAGNQAFASEDGVALEPLEVVFTTRAP